MARRKVELSPERIRTVALELIDRHGLDAFSTRKLGIALGCEAMAIYWYYRSKEDLLDAVVDELVVSIARVVDEASTDWVGTLRAVAHAYRKLAHDHPRAFPLLATRRFSSASTFAFLEKLFGLARAQGISDRTSAQFYRVVSSYCSGFALNELAPQPTSLAHLKKFPAVAHVSKWLGEDQLDGIFEFGLELQLDALRASR
ncbi:MAG: TetR/AcrR family transcriptional regulator [Proteobacteria bacterium]|nr:TetR/AcrR family transcriptional regulator [Pseudomonadota bacterium]